MQRVSIFFALFSWVCFAGVLTTVNGPVDLNRYMGTWHEIARFPNKHQEKCGKAWAEYQKKKDEITVTNQCILADGSIKKVEGFAKVKESTTNAKLEVNFAPNFLRWLGIGWGNYWIIELAPDYSYVVVSEPKREYLWILTRAQGIKKDLYDGIIKRLQEIGFDTTKLIVTGDLL